MNRLTESATREGAIKGTIYQFLSTLSSFIVGSLFYIYLAKFYTAADVGNVAILLAIVGIFGAIFSLGLSQASQHFISYYLGKGQYSNIRAFITRTLIYGGVSSVTAMMTLIFLSPFIAGTLFHALSFIGTIQLLSVYVFVFIMFSILSGVLLGLQRFKRVSIISISTSLLSYGLATVLLFEYHSDSMIVLGWAIGYVLGSLILLFSVIDFSLRHTEKFASFSYKEVMLYSSPILFSGIIGTSAAYFDRFVVAFFMNPATVGIYNFVLLVSSALSIFLIPLYNILLPKFSELFSIHDTTSIIKGVRLSSNMINMLYVPAALGTVALSTRVILLISQPQYLSATLPMAIFLIISAMFITNGLLVQTVSSIRRTPILVFTAIASLISNIFLSIFLIPRYGTTGAAISNSSVNVVTFIILLWYTKLNGVSGLDIVATVKIWLSAGIMALLIFFASIEISSNIVYLPILVVIGGVIFFAIARILRVFSTEDKDWLKVLFSNKYVLLYRLIYIFF